MATATRILADVQGFAGVAHCYQLSESLAGSEYVTVFAVDMPGVQHDETIIVPAYPSGAAVVMNRLPGSLVGWADHGKALALAGYEVVIPAPVETPAAELETPEGDSPSEDVAPPESLSE